MPLQARSVSLGLGMFGPRRVVCILALALACTTVEPDDTRPDVTTPAEWSGRLEGGLTSAAPDPESWGGAQLGWVWQALT